MHDAVLDLLHTAREPRSTDELWAEINLGGLRKPPPDLPPTRDALERSLAWLLAAKRIEKKKDSWYPVWAAEKPVAMLF